MPEPPVDWSKVSHFKPAEWGPAVARLDPRLIYGVDALRAFIGVPIVLHDTTGPGHDPNGAHPQGRAVDCHAVGVSLLAFWLAAERFPEFGGIGLYPHWNNPGLHLDTRKAAHRARWWRDQHDQYLSVTKDSPLWAMLLS